MFPSLGFYTASCVQKFFFKIMQPEYKPDMKDVMGVNIV
jgi:hypothetical protein